MRGVVMTATELRQPVEHITCPEQALRAISIEPDPDDPITAFAGRYLAGSLAGQRLCRGVLTSQDVRDHDDAYGTSLRPLPLHIALSKRYTTRQIGAVGYLTGFRDATVGAADRHECAVCARALVEGMDSFVRCNVDDEWLCSSQSMSCYYDVCTGPRHTAECHDEDGI